MNEENREISGERVNEMRLGEVVDKVGRTKALKILSEEKRRDLQERVNGMPFGEVVYRVGLAEAVKLLSKKSPAFEADPTVLAEGEFLKEQLTGVEGTETPRPMFKGAPVVAAGVVGFGVGCVVGRGTRSQPDSTLTVIRQGVRDLLAKSPAFKRLC